MGKVTVDQIRQRLEGIEQRRRYYRQKWDQAGALPRHEVWRHDYLSFPYLVGAPDNRVEDRFCNIFMNAMELGANGKISPVSMSETDEYMQTFTHMLEEYGARVGGQAPGDLLSRARQPLVKYFERGTPIGVTMFEGYQVPTTPIIVKYGKRQFLEPMMQSGELRVANAGFYNDMGFLDAVRDDETSRAFFIPTFRQRLRGETHLDFQGHRINFDEDDIVMPVLCDDYYLFSLCAAIHYRMPTDFDADAAIVIRDPALFNRRLISAVLQRLPDWEPLVGPVAYYDPYRERDFTNFRVPPMTKHFGYAYQKEVRVAFRPRTKVTAPLEPFFVSIGPMTDYADLVPA